MPEGLEILGTGNPAPDDEHFAVCDWLIRHGYAAESILPNAIGEARADNATPPHD